MNRITPATTALLMLAALRLHAETFTRGFNDRGQIGDNTTQNRPAPVAMSWTPAVSIGTPPAYHFLAPAVTQRLYLRVRVTVP